MEQLNPFRPLHPTHKACKCGYVGPRSLFYKHIEHATKIVWSQYLVEVGLANINKKFFELHGEVPHYESAPKSQT